MPAPIWRRRSPALPARPAARADKPVGLVYFAAASRGGQLLAHESRYGDLGRSQVRRLSVLQALAMLTQLAETV